MNPFVYPKSLHQRTETPKQYKRYQTYKRVLRREFFGRCVYCQMPSSMREYSGFGVDHYRPQKTFPHLSTTYANLYYCCNACNSGKGAYWPENSALEKTHFIPNPCDHRMFDHLRFKGPKVDARTAAGQVAVELLDLNDPESLEFREFILSTIDLYETKKARLMEKRAKVAMGLKAGTMSAADAAETTDRIDAAIASSERWLRKLSGLRP